METGLFIEHRFPHFKVRYIAINDNVDTSKEEFDDIMSIKNLMNEWYVRDTSRKIRAANRAKGNRGERLGSTPPYGYIKDPDNPKKIIIDNEAADIVKKIYLLCAEGNGPAQIAKKLEKEKILRPLVYKLENNIIKSSKYTCKNPYKWNSDTVADILDKVDYLGNTVNFKYTTVSYKDKRKIIRPKEEQLIFYNTHEAIINYELCNSVTSIRKNKRRRTNLGFQDKFSGIVFCKDCSSKMVVHRAFSIKPENIYFTCRNYKKSGAEFCSPHSIKENVLEELCLNEIRRIIAFVKNNEN